MVGVITIDDIVDVIQEEADEDIKRLGGVGSEEEMSDSVWAIARGRFPWLVGQSGHRHPRVARSSACSRTSSSRWWRSPC